MVAKYITISRKNHKYKITREITDQERKDNWYSRRQKKITETKTEVQAKIISSRLALFQYHKATQYDESRYHVIHIPTGLVIADITYDMVGDVKNTFEKSKWTLKDKVKDRNILVLYNDKFQFEMTCLIRYDIKET